MTKGMTQSDYLQFYRDSYDGYYDIGGGKPLDDFNFMMYLFKDKEDSINDFTQEFVNSKSKEAPIVRDNVVGKDDSILGYPEGLGPWASMKNTWLSMKQGPKKVKNNMWSSLETWTDPEKEIRFLEGKLKEYNAYTLDSSIPGGINQANDLDPTEKMFYSLYMDQMDSESPFGSSQMKPPEGMTPEAYARQRAKEDVHGWQGNTRWVDGPMKGYTDFTHVDSLKVKHFDARSKDREQMRDNEYFKNAEIALMRDLEYNIFSRNTQGMEEGPAAFKPTSQQQVKDGIQALTLRLDEAKKVQELPKGIVDSMFESIHENAAKYGAELRLEIEENLNTARRNDSELEKMALWSSDEPSDFYGLGRSDEEGADFFGVPGTSFGVSYNVSPAMAFRDLLHAAETMAQLRGPGGILKIAGKATKFKRLIDGGKVLDRGMQGYLLGLEGNDMQQSTYHDLIEAGYEHDEAMEISVASGWFYAPVSLFLENYGINKITKHMGLGKAAEKAFNKGMMKNMNDSFLKSGFKSVGSWIKHVGTAGMYEMYTEGYQGMWQHIIDQAVEKGYGSDRRSASMNLFQEIRNELGAEWHSKDYIQTLLLPLISPIESVRQQAVAGGIGGGGLAGIGRPPVIAEKRRTYKAVEGFTETKDSQNNTIGFQESQDPNADIIENTDTSESNFELDLTSFDEATYLKAIVNQMGGKSNPISNRDIIAQNDSPSSDTNLDPELAKIIKRGSKKEGDSTAKIAELMNHLQVQGVSDISAWIDSIEGLSKTQKDQVKLRAHIDARDKMSSELQKLIGTEGTNQQQQAEKYMDGRSLNEVLQNAHDPDAVLHYLQHSLNESDLDYTIEGDFDPSKMHIDSYSIEGDNLQDMPKIIADNNARMVKSAKDYIGTDSERIGSAILSGNVKSIGDKLFPFLIANTYDRGTGDTYKYLNKLSPEVLDDINSNLPARDPDLSVKDSIIKTIENLTLPPEQHSERFTPEMEEAVEETIDVSKYREEVLPSGVGLVKITDLSEAEIQEKLPLEKMEKELLNSVIDDAIQEHGNDKGAIRLAIRQYENLDSALGQQDLNMIDRLVDLKQEGPPRDESAFLESLDDTSHDAILGTVSASNLTPEQQVSAVEGVDLQANKDALKDPQLTLELTEETTKETCVIDTSDIDISKGEY